MWFDKRCIVFSSLFLKSMGKPLRNGLTTDAKVGGGWGGVRGGAPKSTRQGRRHQIVEEPSRVVPLRGRGFRPQGLVTGLRLVGCLGPGSLVSFLGEQSLGRSAMLTAIWFLVGEGIGFWPRGRFFQWVKDVDSAGSDRLAGFLFKLLASFVQRLEARRPYVGDDFAQLGVQAAIHFFQGAPFAHH